MNKALLRLIVGHLCIHACMAGFRMAAPLLALRQGYSPAAVGVLLALFALSQVFLALPAGRFVDKHGLRRPVRWSVAVASLGAGIAVVFPVFPVMCLGALLTGGATGVASVAVQRHAGRAATDSTQLRQVFSWLAIGPAISNFIGPFSAGLVIDHAGFRAAFALMAVLPLATWVLVHRTAELPPAPLRPASARAWDLAREPMMRRLLLTNWVLASCWDVHTFVVPLLGHERGFSASVIGSLLGAFAVAAALIRVVLPAIAARLSERLVIAWAMAATAVLFGVYPLLQTPLAMGMCSVLLGVALGSVQPMIMSMLHQITPSNRHGEAIGLRLMAITASSVVMPLLFGSAGVVIGVAGVFWVTGVAVALGTRAALRLKTPG